ncbi:MAG: hypothetical protein JRK26_23145 [Deltaproteobacteria bacterium]|nr:hypothetical protein [Deltaproteobacteria bacterium]
MIWINREGLGGYRGRIGKKRDLLDLLVYVLWDSGFFTNQQIGGVFGLVYLTVSWRVGICRDRLSKDYRKRKD